MAIYLKINNQNVSNYVNSLKISTKHKYSAQTNASGGTVVDIIGQKKVIEVGFIPLEVNFDTQRLLQLFINHLVVSVEYLDPENGVLKSIQCLLPENEIEYYTIQDNKKIFNGYTLTFYEM